MTSVIAGIFGGSPKGPSAAQLKREQESADRLKLQDEQIAAQTAKEAKKLQATKQVIAASSGSGQGITLNPATGEQGVAKVAKLGGGT